MSRSTGAHDSPASHGCRTPIKKPKRPPNYVGYNDECSDGLFEENKLFVFNPIFLSIDEFRIHSIHDKSRL